MHGTVARVAIAVPIQAMSLIRKASKLTSMRHHGHDTVNGTATGVRRPVEVPSPS